MKYFLLTVYSIILFLNLLNVSAKKDKADKLKDRDEAARVLEEAASKLDPIGGFKLKYTTLFKGVRKQHFEAIKRISSIEDLSRRNEMMKILVEKSLEPLAKAKELVSSVGTTEEIIVKAATDEDVRNALSSILENSAFHGDLALHFPDSYHKYYDSFEQFKSVLEWCVKFSNETGLFDGVTREMINLMSQELGIIPKTDDFINPYTLANLKKSNKKDKKSSKDSDKKKKKSKEKKKRGPGMSKTEL